MITKTLNALRGYNGVAKIPDNISIGGVEVAPVGIYRAGQGVDGGTKCAVGDSITYGHPLGTHPYTNTLRALIGSGTIVNVGSSGALTDDMVNTQLLPSIGQLDWDFTSDYYPWYSSGGAVLTIEAGSLKVAHGALSAPRCRFDGIIPGKTYRLTGTANGDGTAATSFIVDNGIGIIKSFTSSPLDQQMDVEFVAAGTGLYVGLAGSVTGNFVKFQNIKLDLLETDNVSDSDVLILGGVNDISTGVPVADIKKHLEFMWDQTVLAGLRPIAIRLTPWSVSGALKTVLLDLNDWIQATAPGPVVDTSDLGDVNYDILPIYDLDGLHFNSLGYAKLGEIIFDAQYTCNPALPACAGSYYTYGGLWTAYPAAVDNDWQSIAYGNGTFVAVADSGSQHVMTSPDGITWTARTAAESNLWKSVTYGDGLFVAVSFDGTNRVMTSPDGITWTSRTAAAQRIWTAVTYGNGLFVAVSYGGAAAGMVMTSPDGITWTARTASVDNSWYGVGYGNGLFVAVAISGTGDRVMTSPDGITWTTRTSAADNRWYGVAYGSGVFVAVSNTGTGDRVMTSPDGITWTSRTNSVDNDFRAVTYGDGTFVAVAYSGTGDRVMTSPDGITWTTRTTPVDNNWYGVAYANRRFVAVSKTGTGDRVMISDYTELSAEALCETGTGAAPTFDVPAYGNGPDDRAIRFNGEQYLQAVDPTYGNIGGAHFIARFALIPSGAAEVFGSKRDGGVGYEFGIDSSNRLYCIVQDATGSTTVVSAALETGQTYEADFAGGRDTSSWDPSTWYVNGSVSGTPTSIASRSLSLDNTELFTVGATSGGSSNSTSSLIYMALWIVEPGPAVPPASEFLDDFQKWCDEYPDLALGTPNPTYLQAETTFIEEYDPADGFISLHNIAEDVGPVGRVRDLAGELFYGYRLAGYVENLIPYSNDLSGWTVQSAAVNTAELIETSSPGTYHQGVVGAATTAQHGIYINATLPAGDYCFSALVPTDGSEDWIELLNTTNGDYAYFNKTTGVVGTKSGFTDSNMLDMGDGQYLVWAVGTSPNGVNVLRIYAADDDLDDITTGDADTPQFYAAFIQVETGIYPNPRVFTDGVFDYRDVDSIMYKLDDGAAPDSSKFFLQFEYLNQYGPPVSDHPLAVIGGTSDHDIWVTAAGLIDVNSGDLTSITAITDGYKHKIGLWVNGAHADLYIDDNLEATTESLAVVSSLQFLLFQIADRGNQQSAPQWVRDVNLYTDNPYIRLYADEAQEGDVLLYQTTDEGEMNIVDGITEMTPTFDTMFYLSLFGGNEDDPGGSDTTKQWWGNIDEPDPAYQYRSKTQYILRSTNANSTNLKRLENAVISDLTRDFIDTGIASDLTVVVSIPRLNRVNISGTINADGETIPFKFTANWEASV